MPRRVLLLSDLHFEPRYSPHVRPACKCASEHVHEPSCRHTHPASTLGQIGCDTSPALMSKSLAAAAAAVPDAALVLLGGDLAWHGSKSRDETLAVFVNVSAQIANAFPTSVRSCAAIGNNDVYPDYAVDPSNSTYYRAQAAAISTMCELPADAATNLAGRGFFARELEPGFVIVALNTDVYSIESKVRAETAADPLGQFEWLEAQLAAAEDAGSEVWVVGHIPPALDSHERLPMWQEPYAARYWKLVVRYSAIISAQLYGHLHTDAYRLFDGDASPAAGAPPLILLPSISPIFKSNPAFAVLELPDPTAGAARRFLPSSLTVHYLDLRDGDAAEFVPEYSTSDYGFSALTDANYRDLTASFEDSADLQVVTTRSVGDDNAGVKVVATSNAGDASFARFFDRFKAQNKMDYARPSCDAPPAFFTDCRECVGGCKAAFICLLRHGLTAADHKACLDAIPAPPLAAVARPPDGAIAYAVVGAVLVVLTFFAVAVVLRRRRRRAPASALASADATRADSSSGSDNSTYVEMQSS